MRVLYWVEGFWPYIGGTEVWATKYLLALRDRGNEVMVVTRQDSADLRQEDQYRGILVYRFPVCSALMDGNIDQLIETRQQVARLKRTFAPDLIHQSSVGPSILFHLDTAHVHPAPHLITLHGGGTLVAGGPDSLVGRALRTADWVVGCSAAILHQGRQLVPEITPCSSIIYNGLEFPLFPPKPLPFDAPLLLCLGRLDQAKGFDLALNAFSSVVARFPQARLVMAGDGPERLELKRLTTKLGLSDVVDFAGWVAPDAVQALMNTATVVVMPSRREAFGLVALQAAQMARPVVATHVGGLPEVVVHQQTGLLVESGDSNALAEAIAFLLDHPETANQMGQAARRRAREVFSWTRCLDAYESLYRKLTKMASHAHSAHSLPS